MKLNIVVFNMFVHFCLISDGNSIEFDNFYVEKSGHSKVKPGEIAVVFYMTVANSGTSSKKIYSKNTKCCWLHPGGGFKYDCESMDLHGGMPVNLEPSKTANISYLFTNLYPLDRVGQCVFHLWHSKNKIAHTIRFNTTYESQEQESWLGSLYKKIAGDEKRVKVCDTFDLDPRRNCKPVKCVQKYNGKRNYFRKETKLCEPVHECYTSKDDEGLPTTAFDKDHNKCKSLIQKELTRDEEKDLKDNMESHMETSEKAKFRNIGPSDPIPIRCNHGKRAGDICICDNGWKTDTSNVPLGDPKFVYNWCNVRTRKKPLLPYKQQKYFMIAGLSLTSFTLLVTWLWMIHRYIYPQADGVEKGPKARQNAEKRHVWMKTNMLATSKLLRELAGRKKPGVNTDTTELTEEESVCQSSSPLKSKSIQKGKSALSVDKHSAKNLLSFRSLTSEVRSRSSSDSNNVEDMASSDLEPPPSFKENTNQCISNVLAHSVRDATQENINKISIAPVLGRAVSQQQSLSSHVPKERSVEKSYVLPSSIQHTNSSIAAVQAPHEYAINVTGDKQQRSYSMPGQISGKLFRNADDTMKQQRSHSFPTQIRPDGLENQKRGRRTSVDPHILQDGSRVSTDGEEPIRIVASRKTRAGSTYTLSGPPVTQRRLSTSSPVKENFSDSD